METKTRIFTADANIDFCKMLERIMAAENDMELVGNAADGVEALAMVAQLKPDILLLECRMNGAGSAETAEKILKADSELLI